MARHPELAVLALEAISSWSRVEAFFLQLFVSLMGGDKTVAASMYLSLDGQSAKSRALNAVAEQVLGPKPAELALFRALLRLAKSREKARNKLAHWAWGEASAIPDALILADPRTLLAEDVDEAEIYVYSADDFKQIARDNAQLCSLALRMLYVVIGHPANADGGVAAELRASRDLAGYLEVTPPPAQ